MGLGYVERKGVSSEGQLLASMLAGGNISIWHLLSHFFFPLLFFKIPVSDFLLMSFNYNHKNVEEVSV